MLDLLVSYDDGAFDMVVANLFLPNCDGGELLAAIKQVHEGGAPMTSYIARKVVQAFQRQQSEKPEVNELSPREWEVLELLSRGYSYKEISSALAISIPTVNTHLHRTYEKLHVRSRGEAVAKFSSFPPRLPVSSTRAPQ